MKKLIWGSKVKQGKSFYGNFFYKSKIKAIFSYFEGNFFAQKNFVLDRLVLAFGRRMENKKSNWVNSMKKALITRHRLFSKLFGVFPVGSKFDKIFPWRATQPPPHNPRYDTRNLAKC